MRSTIMRHRSCWRHHRALSASRFDARSQDRVTRGIGYARNSDPWMTSATNPFRLFSTAASPQVQLDDDGIQNSDDGSDYKEAEVQPVVASATVTPEIEGKLREAGIQSRPVPGGRWQPENPLDWALGFGRRSPEDDKRLEPLVRLEPGDEGYFNTDHIKLPSVTIVRTREHARRVVERLMAVAPQSVMHACDTEVMDIALKKVGPVGNGYVTCASIYSGPEFDYGDGPGTCLWIDNLDEAAGVLQEFKEWFEDERHLKVWHNYGFDRHVMWNEGIDVQGFGGDTMHMARLQDTSRGGVSGRGGYSLEALTADLVERRKRPMKEIFGVKRLRKDGSEGLLVDIPPVEVMQRDPQFRAKWIEYSCYDAQGTWIIREKLQRLLLLRPWYEDYSLWDYYWLHMRPFGEVLTDMERRGVRVNARDYLAKVEEQARKDRTNHSQVFRDWAATKIGADGLAMNPASATQLQTFLFGGAQNTKTKEFTETVRTFKVLREEIPEVALAAYEAQAAGDKQDANDEDEEQSDQLDKMKAAQLKVLCKEYGLKVSGKKADLIERIRDHILSPKEDDEAPLNDDGLDEMTDDDLRDSLKTRGLAPQDSRADMLKELRKDMEFTASLSSTMESGEARSTGGGGVARTIIEALELAAKKDSNIAQVLDDVRAKETAVPKFMDLTISSLGLRPEKYTAGGAPSVTADVLRKLAGDPFADPPKYGTAFDSLGKEGCEALFSLCAIGSIDTMIANFLTSLQELADDKSRVHCSLNLNTETGRLSSRRPNLQNQPALEKDKYQIRKAFESSPGHNLIVADYGQLELRLLASMTDCTSMIDAFEAGGDFHSRTAIDMFDYVKAKVDSGEALLEWDYENGEPPKPLVKDLFASERRKAKTLNFSIAYGKTAHGLSADWGVTIEEANDMLKAWYQARPEVEKWQKNTKQIAREEGYTRTLMGRYRELPAALSKDRRFLGAAERASINTPIQGGAADVAMMAMNKINKSEKLKALGWILLLQVHDEVMLEGPEETAEEAFAEVIECMQEPWVFGLEKTAVPLLVDGSFTHKNWYEAK